MATYSGSPVVGQDANGNTVMLLTMPTGEVSVTGNTNTYNQNNDWQYVSVNQLAKSSAGVIAFGSGVDANGTTVPLTWAQDGAGWKISKVDYAPNQTGGIEYYNSQWVVATGAQVVASNYQFTAPVSGYSATAPAASILATINANLLSKDSADLIAASTTNIGTWRAADDWSYNTGPATQVATGHIATTYTFPGFAAADPQVQYANLTDGAEGFGLMGDPQMTVSWSV